MTDTRPDRWLLFSPHLPATPSSLRVLVWRRMQTLGALNVHTGLWLLPHTQAHEQRLSSLRAELEQQGGQAWIFTSSPLDAQTTEQVVLRFQDERQKDYHEFASRCQEFHHELEREKAAQNWTFAELDENEQDLHKLTQWLRQIQQRDFFPTTSSKQALAQLDGCRHVLHHFAQEVYAHQGVLSSQEAEALDETVNSAPEAEGGEH